MLCWRAAVRGCQTDSGQTMECKGDVNSGFGRKCYCKEDKCNTAARSTPGGQLTAIVFVTVTAVAGHIIGY